jgi:hypothetical protein
MPLTDAPSRLLPLVEELLDNRYAREKLREGTAALASGRGKPKRTGRKVVLATLALAAAGSAAALALNDGLRESVFGSAKALGEEISGSANDSRAAGEASAG